MGNLNYMLSGRYNGSNIVIKAADKEKIIDTEDIEYIDYVLGNLTQISGHRGIDIAQTVTDVSKNYINVGDNSNIHSGLLAKKVLEISNMDMLRFTNSGSEAVHLALRVARAYTGKSKVLKFIGHYHGWLDEEISNFLDAEISEGINATSQENVIKVSWNNKEQVTEAFEKYGNKIAAIILEPVLAHSGTIPPFDGFLEFLREKTKQTNTVLIFDECVTGFRVALGGAQEKYNIAADIVVYSKAISGGFPLGVVAGKKHIMEKLYNGQVYQASTYDSNPFSSAIALKVIEKMQEEKIIETAIENGNKLMNGMKDILEKYKQKVIFQGVGSYFQFYFTDKTEIKSYEDAITTDYKKFQKIMRSMYSRKIIMSEGELWSENPKRNWIGSVFVSSKHNDEVIAKTLIAFEESVKENR